MLMSRDFRNPQAQDFSMLFVVDFFRVICFYLGCKVLKLQDAIVAPLRYSGLQKCLMSFWWCQGSVNHPFMGGIKLDANVW